MAEDIDDTLAENLCNYRIQANCRSGLSLKNAKQPQ